MYPDMVIDLLDRQLTAINESPAHVELSLLQGIWENLSYGEIGSQEGYSPEYLANVAAPKLYKKLSKLINKRVTKKNCRSLVESYLSLVGSEKSSSYPSGAVPLNSPLYIERQPIEQSAYEEIQKPGALIRIKAAKAMGKTSLLLRILNCADALGYRIVKFNFAQIDCAILGDINRFLRFICASATQQLELESQLEEYWDADIGSKVSCSLYLRGYLLQQIDSPVVLAFDELNRIFEYPQVAKDFLPLLRSWYEEAKINPIWKKLRQIVVHSTEVYIPLNINQSPFNVGLPIQLSIFQLCQVEELAQKYQLDSYSSTQLERLVNLVGGHPALIQIALYHLSRQEVTLSELLKTASTPKGVYHNHLRHLWLILEAEPELAKCCKLLLKTNLPEKLKPVTAYKLGSMGLIEQIGDEAVISCELYRCYFAKNFDEDCLSAKC